MISPEVHSIGSVDVSDPLATWQPSDRAFYLDLDVFMGPAGTEVEERFTLYVCSPAWLEKSIEDNGPLDGRHMFIANEFDYPRIRAWIDSVVKDSTGADWDEVAAKLGRYFAWEFEPGTYVWSSGDEDIDTRINGEPEP
ncbi:MAG TPA: Imm8 family immunity protein [Streptosporangiales bacterium]